MKARDSLLLILVRSYAPKFKKNEVYNLQNKNDYIETFSGIPFDPFHPSVKDINIIDIAHAISQTCRFGGHCKHFYSVAQHSILVSKLLKDSGASIEVQLYGLLHDATEGYMVDLPSPIKKQLPYYKKAEKHLQTLIWKALGIRKPTEEEWKQVKKADKLLQQHEANQLLLYASWADPTINLENIIIQNEPIEKVKKQFLDLYHYLRKQVSNG
jgi:uncharacterized protein